MSEAISILEEARAVLERKRVDLATIIIAGENLGEMSVGLTNIQNGVEALDRAILDEKRRADAEPKQITGR